MVALRRLWRWGADHQFAAAVVLFTLVVAGAFVRDAYREVEKDRFVECLAAWADDTSARSSRLDAAGGRRVEAADALWRDFAVQIQGPPDRARFEGLLADYIAVSDDLRGQRRDNPVPDPPRIRC